jgi:hypothetical protein
MVVGTYAVSGSNPTVAYFLWADSDETIRQYPPPWLNDDTMLNGYLTIDNKRVELVRGCLLLYVGRNNEKPIRVVLDNSDARKFFGKENTEFVNEDGFLRFWELLQNQYPEVVDVSEPAAEDRDAMEEVRTIDSGSTLEEARRNLGPLGGRPPG